MKDKPPTPSKEPWGLYYGLVVLVGLLSAAVINLALPALVPLHFLLSFIILIAITIEDTLL